MISCCRIPYFYSKFLKGDDGDMNRLRSKSKKEDVRKITMLVAKLNRYRHEYYNKSKPSVSDAVYDHLFDELQKLVQYFRY